MKKVLYLIMVCGLAFTSCTKFDFDANRDELIKENAESIFGIIDPKQDWKCVDTGTIQVTADAPLKTITKIQILTESPFFNDQAKVLAEVDATKGETKTLSFDSPRGDDLLVAACLDDGGHYYIKGFSLGDSKVSFRSSSNQARTRSASRTISTPPDLSQIRLLFENSESSFNAQRTIKVNGGDKTSSILHWKDTGWEDDRLWIASGSMGDGWYFNNGSIYRDVDPITEDEKEELLTIFNSSLYRSGSGTNKRDNLKLINESSAVQLFDNHLIANGKAPISFIPVQLASTEAGLCDLYYYYFKEEDVAASGLTKIDYIKQLPKFKAVDFETELSVFSSGMNFEKHHEFILPFYGSPSNFKKVEKTLKHVGYQAEPGIYRIKNAEKGMCITYSTENKSDHSLMAPFADDDSRLPNQLWQLFTRESDNSVLFYNIGTGTFLYYNNQGYPSFQTVSEDNLLKCSYLLIDESNSPTTRKTDVRIAQLSPTEWNNKCVIKADASIRIAMDKNNKSIRLTTRWTMEEYGHPENFASSVKTPSDLGLGTTTYEDPDITPSPIIEAGYNVGFMLRKVGNANSLNNDKNGCLYSYGELNTEINHFGQFNSAVQYYSMEYDDPRIGMFNANLKTYLCFEDGSDCNFSDIIIELGGFNINAIEKDFSGEDDYTTTTVTDDPLTISATSGAYLFDFYDEMNFPDYMPFTMCFEDRPIEADYDMNDVVLRCIRLTKTRMQLTLIATGAYDRLLICGIPGTPVRQAQDLNNQEVHYLFGMEDATGEDQFINTQVGQKYKFTGIACAYDVDESMTVPQFLSKIYIKNLSYGDREIRVPTESGQPPLVLIIPGDFNYPKEKTRITNAYSTFETWAKNANYFNDWTDFYDENLVYPNTQE